ncbi:MAG: UDP-N-acetylmuramoyl-tripeptide--D-alanyl-D-alanine ligase [Methylotenera sp.]|nr:MAG: UDP-N-acetylmuramoyl-tripeptide--D-alanyl-D-alanine ligase [Methylotenera sp.]
MMQLSTIAQAINGKLLGADVAVQSVGTDSRAIVSNQLFVAIKGENFDGNQFAETAIQQGAAAVLVSDAQTKARPAILVDDTKLALGQLAKYWRNQFHMPVIAITGSNGKTTTKEMLTAILGAATKDAQKVHATVGNLNNDIGMPLTLLKLRKEHAYAVIEMGMNHLGEIDYLSRIAQPNIALINNAGTAHIGELGSRENIAKAKGEVFNGLNVNGVAVINADDAFCAYWQSLNAGKKIITFAISKAADVTASYEELDGLSHMQLNTPTGSITFKLNVLGKHNIANALAASAAAVALGVSNQDIANGLQNMQAVRSRLQRKTGLNEALLIDDTYNANPDSMKAAIDVLAAMGSCSVFVMGDMGELGADAAKMHTEIGVYAKQKGIGHLLALGELSELAATAFGEGAQHFLVLDDVISNTKKLMQKNVTVLVKGSRFMKMERVVAPLTQQNSEKSLMEDAQCY